MVSLPRWFVVCGLALLASACGQDVNPLTQLVLVTDTDIQALDTIQFVITSDSEGTQFASASRVGVGAPSFLSLVHDRGPLGPVMVSARGLHGGTQVLERTQRVYFVQDQTRVVPLHLLSSCTGVVCADGLTCSEQGCVSETLNENELPVWTGEPPRAPQVSAPDASVANDAGALDAGEPDAGEPDSGEPMDAGRTPRDGGKSHPDGSLDAQVDDAQVPGGDASSEGGSPRDAASDAGDAGPKLTQCGDAGLFDLQSALGHCGKCSKACNVDTEQCVAGACTKK